MDNNNKSSRIINASIIALVLLLILSLTILFVRLAISLPYTDDTFVINPHVDPVETGDDDVIWDLDTDVTIFRTTEVDEDGNVVVESIDGDNIIAPGMEGDYRFEVRNTGKFAVETKTIVSAKLTVNGEIFEDAPIEVRFANYKGENITEGGWIKVNELSEHIDDLTVGKKSYIYFDLDWRWAYEGNDDELDTLLGNLSVDNEVEFSINIVIAATRSGNRNAEGGLPLVTSGPTGFDIRPIIIVTVVVLLVTITLLIIEKKRNKERNQKYRFVEKK